LDAGFTLGAGAFETLLALDGEPFEWDRHHTRLSDGLARLGSRVPDREMLRSACRETAAAAGLERLRLRVTVSAGRQLPGAGLDPAAEPTILITASLLPQVPASVRLATVTGGRNPDSPLAGTKSISYAENLMFLAQARRAGADEALLVNTRGEICEAATANVFFVRGGILRTPPLESGCLPGVARALVLEDADALGLAVDTSDCLPEELAAADEAFLTSSTRGVVAVSTLDGKPFPMVPGPMTTRLRDARRRREEEAMRAL
jgi:branched-chain amino acid aminotransferase